MSAYIVENKTINRILAGLENDNRSGMRPALPAELMAARGNNASRAALGQAIQDINIASVKARYPDDKDSNLPGPCAPDGMTDLSYTYTAVPPPTDVAMVKAIHCWIYQSCESEECRNNPIFQALEHYVHSLCYHIISQMPAYKEAPWG